jgi:ERCC4-type nuclease
MCEDEAMKIITDSREQRPFGFTHERYAGTTIEAGTLTTGDYSLAGLEDKIAVERKTLDDLVACLTRERPRFERELQRAAGLESFAVVIESSWADVAGGTYRSHMNPHAACQSVLAFTVKYRIPFIFAGSRPSAEYITWGLLRQYLEIAKKRYSAIIRAHEQHVA